MAKNLLIVESPAKAKTIGKYLGKDFVVKSSVGHIRDLPKENGAIKIEGGKDGPWKFVPSYIVSEGKEKVVAELKTAVKACSEIYLASDPDREGEAIAWHLKEVLEPVAGEKPFKRVTYNEITKTAVKKAVAEPRDIDMPLVDAQQARRILDRLVGYKVSPLLWKNISCANNRSLSAGRVQSVALRLLVERQREIDAFQPETFYLLGAEARKSGEEQTFTAKLSRYDGEKPEIKDKDIANTMILDLAGATLEVADLKAQPKSRHALPPFTTSTLQQTASSVLGFGPGKTMKLAQALYEAGYITYMRTDSVNISDQARDAAKEFIEKYCGAEYYPEKPNFFKSKADAQGAHEAIRPTDIMFSPKFAAEKLEAADLKLYDLIWRRFVASQMADAKTTVRTISLKAKKTAIGHDYLFTASATTVDFEGFLKIMKLSLKKKTKDGEDDEDTDEVTYLPEVKVGETLDVVRWISDEKKTKGPSHYSEASLIKALEENGVGRPSTYAATIETLKAREYAKTEKKKLIPLERGILVCDWLVSNMESLFSVGFTAKMEAELDKVAEQGEPMNQMLSEFYHQFLGAMPPPVPPPDAAKFEAVFAILADVKTWKEAKKVGKRVYDDEAFVKSCLDQFKAGAKPMSQRQLDFLVRMVLQYSEQIPDFQQRLDEAGLTSSKPVIERAEPELVLYCIEVMDRVGGLGRNAFLKSLREQHERGKPLSVKQLVVLAKALAENIGSLPDAEDVREKLASMVPGGLDEKLAAVSDPVLPALMKYLETVTFWRKPTRKGKRIFDDGGFYKSLAEQYNRRGTLSVRQVSALKRMLRMYKDCIPDYEARSAEFGLEAKSITKEDGAAEAE